MTGLRIDTNELRKRLGKVKSSLPASAFKPELIDFTKATLTDCIVTTPVRAEAKIVKAQRKQYRNRINAIPSVHTLTDPALRVNNLGEEWIFTSGKWYRGDWYLPDEVYAVYMELSQERHRRMATAEVDFINQRKQARFLYQRSWWQVAVSLQIQIPVGEAIPQAHTRHNPPKEPPKAHGQWRGGQTVLSVAVFNSFLDAPGMYWKGDGKEILAKSTAKNLPKFRKAIADKVRRTIRAVRGGKK